WPVEPARGGSVAPSAILDPRRLTRELVAPSPTPFQGWTLTARPDPNQPRISGSEKARMTMLPLRRSLLLIALSTPLIAPVATRAGIMPIGPFVGTSSENFDSPGVDGATQTLTVFGGLATIQNLTSGGALKVERSSSLDGDLVVPRSGTWMVGQLGIAQWTFAN